MPGSRITLMSVFFAAVMLLSACTGSSTEAPTTTVDSTPSTVETIEVTTTTLSDSASPTTLAAPATQIVLTIDPESGEAVETEIEELGPSTYAEVVDAGVESGMWDVEEGLRLTLGYAVGAVPASDIPGIESVLTAEFSDVLDEVREFLEGGATNEDLERWYDLARPSAESISLMIAGANGPEALGESPTAIRASVLAQGASSCSPVDPDNFSDWGTFTDCYKLIEATVAGATLIVLYPTFYDDDEGLAELPRRTLDAMTASANTYSPLAKVGDTTTIFSIAASLEGNPLAVATDGAVTDTGAYPQGCPITVFPSANQPTGRFEQTVAHEFWHCVQESSGYPEYDKSTDKWIVEGGAEYFSNVVYPGVDDEHRTLHAFDVRSKEAPIFKASYAAWIWWQFLANETSPGSVAGVMLAMVNAGDGGRSTLETYGPLFQKFTVWYVAGQINDASGALIPPATIFNKPVRKVTKNDKGKEYEFDSEPFVTTRYLISYAPQLRVFQSSDTSTGGPIAMVKYEDRQALGAWSAQELEIRSKCEKEAKYVLVSTSGEEGHSAKVTINKIEKAVCDPCVLGTWAMNLDDFEAAVLQAGAQGGQSLPAGTTIDISGGYYTSLDDEGKLQEQRDGLTITMGTGGNSISFVIDSFGVGTYEADGEKMSVANIQDLFTEVSTNVPGLGGMTFVQDPTFTEGASGPYVCDKDTMTVTLSGEAPISFERIDKILTPPPLEIP